MTRLSSPNRLRILLAALVLSLAPAAASAGVFVSVSIAPPALPVYVQPVCPGDGYLWNPGYWAYGPEGYYWVPGVWVRPPQVGLLWTPGYWGWGGGAYLWHAGYWGPHVGFYGGINYGFGYGGTGFVGGRWNGGVFAYNTAVVNVNRTVIHNTYVENVHVTNVNVTNVHTSFNGGNGGVPAQPSPQETQWSRESHVAPTAEQQQHLTLAHADHSNFASANGGHPQNAAVPTVGARVYNQQQRIGQGVQSGQLTPRETGNLENRESSIHQQAQADRAATGGRLSPQERQGINQRQNNVSRSINQDQHNSATEARPAPRAEGGREGGGERPR